MINFDPHDRIMVIIGQLKNDIIHGPGGDRFKWMELEKCKNKAADLLLLTDGSERKLIEKAFSLPAELEAML